MKSILYLIVFFVTLISADAQKQVRYKILPDTLITNDMKIEIFNIEFFKDNEENNNLIITNKDGTIIEQYVGLGENPEKGNNFFEYTTLGLPKLYRIYKEYYLNGKLKKFGYYLYPMLMISKWYYYDEKGNEAIVDEDLKFGKFDYNKVVQMLAKMGYLNLQTGQGRERIRFGYDKKIRNSGSFTFFKKKTTPKWDGFCT